MLKDFFPYEPDTVNYLAHISDVRRYFYFGNPKVGSTAVLALLQSAESGRAVPAEMAVVHDRAASPLRNFVTSNHSPETVLAGDFFRFTFVRNPYTRTLSAFLHKVEGEPWAREEFMPKLGLDPAKEISFATFLHAVREQRDDERDIHWRSQSGMLCPERVAYDFVGRFEIFPFTLPYVIERCGAMTPATESRFADGEFAVHGSTGLSKLRAYLGQVERDLIGEIYERDFRSFCYSADPAFAHL